MTVTEILSFDGQGPSLAGVRIDAIQAVQLRRDEVQIYIQNRVFAVDVGRYAIEGVGGHSRNSSALEIYKRIFEAMQGSSQPEPSPAPTIDNTASGRLELVSVERRPEEAELLQDCALAARLMTEAIGWMSSASFIDHADNRGARVCIDYMLEFVRSYEHVIDLRRDIDSDAF